MPTFERYIEEKDYSEWTKCGFKVLIKIFYRWLSGSDSYPEEVRNVGTYFIMGAMSETRLRNSRR